jgi:hypothetical protein
MLYLVQHPVQLISGFNNTVTVIAVHNEDKTLCVLEVMPPERSDLFSGKCVQFSANVIKRGHRRSSNSISHKLILSLKNINSRKI